MLRKLLVFAVTSGLAARAARSWLARRDQRHPSATPGPRSMQDHAQWADDGGRVMPPVPAVQKG